VRTSVIRGRIREAVRQRVKRAHPAEWLGGAIVFGALFGLATLLRRQPGATLGLMVAPASDTYLESLHGILITIIGFVIVAFVFIYEQQRRTWRIAFRIRDQHRAEIVRGAALSLVLILISFWAGLMSLIESDSGDLMLAKVWPTAVAAAAGFSGVAGAITTSVLVVQMLAPRRLARRILAAPNRISPRDELEEQLTPSRHLMELALAEHRAEDDEEFRSRISTLQQYGCAAYSRREAEDTVRSLLDIALLVFGRRDRVVSAVQAAQKVAGGAVFTGNGPSEAAENLLGKVVTLLDRNLTSEQPSASLTAEILKLGNDIHPDPAQQRRLFELAVRRTAFRAEPSDLWDVVVGPMKERMRASVQHANNVVPIGVLDLMHAMDPAKQDGRTTGRGSTDLAVSRALGLLVSAPHLDEGGTSELDHASVRNLHQNLLLHLCIEGVEEPRSPDGQTLSLLRSLARRSSHFKSYDWLDPRLPERYRSSIIMLGEVTKALSNTSLRNALVAEQIIPKAARSRVSSCSGLLTSDPSIAAEALEFTLDSLPDLAEKRLAAIVLRVLMWPNESLRGVVGLTGFVLLRDASLSLHRSGREGVAAGDIGSLQEYARIGTPVQGFFSPGLEDCADRSKVLLNDAMSLLAQTNLLPSHYPSEPDDLTDASGAAPEVDPRAEEDESLTPLVVFAQLSLLLGAALASHLDGEEGLRVFAGVSRAISRLPVTNDRPMARTTSLQMLLDGLTLSTIAFDLARSERTDPATGAGNRARGSTDVARLLDVTSGLQQIRAACEPVTDPTEAEVGQNETNEDEDEDGSYRETLQEFADAQDALVEQLSEPVARTIVDQVSSEPTKERGFGFIPWSVFPERAWDSVADVLRSEQGRSLDTYRTLSMIAELAVVATTPRGLSTSFTALVRTLTDHPGLTPHAEGKLCALIADDLARQRDIAGAKVLLESAKMPDHYDILLRHYFIRLAHEENPQGGAEVGYVRGLCFDKDPRKVFGVVECALHWMRSVNGDLKLWDCMMRIRAVFKTSNDALTSAGLAVAALRGSDLRGGLHMGQQRLAGLARTTRAQIAGMERVNPRSGLILGLDPVTDTARSTALHIVMLAIMAQQKSAAFDPEAAQTHRSSALEQLEELGGPVRKQLTSSLEAVERRLGART
jgi:hypothetical protein